jgi:hypothetical protein
MPDDNEHDYQPTRAEILERYGWKPGEKEQLAAEMAERQARIKHDETLARCEQRAERPPQVAEKTYAQKKQDEAAAMGSLRSYVSDELDRRDRVTQKLIARVVVDEERRREQSDENLMTIISDVRNRFDEMDARLGELEARMSKRRGATTPTCDATPRGFDRDAFNGWRQ